MTNKIEDLKLELDNLFKFTAKENDVCNKVIDHLSQNDRWKAFVPDDMVVVPREPTKK